MVYYHGIGHHVSDSCADDITFAYFELGLLDSFYLFTSSFRRAGGHDVTMRLRLLHHRTPYPGCC
jgi:hypothetical protein